MGCQMIELWVCQGGCGGMTSNRKRRCTACMNGVKRKRSLYRPLTCSQITTLLYAKGEAVPQCVRRGREAAKNGLLGRAV